MREINSGLFIEVCEGEDRGRIIALPQGRIPLGRQFHPGERKAKWILFADHSITRFHAVMEWDGEAHAFKFINKSHDDLASINGTLKESAFLSTGDEVTIGAITFRLIDELGPGQRDKCEHVPLHEEKAHESGGDDGESPPLYHLERKKITPQFVTTAPQEIQEGEKVKKKRTVHPREFTGTLPKRLEEEKPDFSLICTYGKCRGEKIPFLYRDLPEKRQFYVYLDKTPSLKWSDAPRGTFLFILSFARSVWSIIPGEGSLKINNRPAEAQKSLPLRTGDLISTDSMRLVFIEHQLLTELLKWEIHVIKGKPEDMGKHISLSREITSIGRGKANDLTLTDRDVALRQVTLHYHRKSFFLVQRSSQRLSYLGSALIKVGGRKNLHDGSVMRLSSHTTILFRRGTPLEE
ncbi:MAG: FHA domain-containing protein [Candidatus Eremiobacteraeota bacterium]|nr:FHA domain-containing protein [Candidatus Eremiobacteraeota bacterium]